ncbi:PD-(D/E)XK nuclease family protein [Ancylomarina sp. YFZ004]
MIENKNMQIESLNKSLNLINSISNEINLNFTITISFLNKFNILFEKEYALLPYHLNLIDELHANENAHSRILAQILRYKKSDDYIFLQTFIENLCDFDLNIKNPEIRKVDSCGRIDIPIFDDDFVLIIENKVTDKAADQNIAEGGQIARYIESVNVTYNINKEDIYVVYTPRFTRECSDECWVNQSGYSYKKEFEDRYCSISYRDNILSWLKNQVLPLVKSDEKYFYSAIVQYIDYLEGIYSLREINKEFNMKLQDFIKQELELNSLETEKAIDILSEKENELNNALTQINNLKIEYKKKQIAKVFENWKKQLINDFPNLEIVKDNFTLNGYCINLGVKFPSKDSYFSILIECNDASKPNLYYGIGRHYVSEVKNAVSIELDESFKKSDSWWYGWKYCSLDNAYSSIKILINKVVANPNT